MGYDAKFINNDQMTWNDGRISEFEKMNFQMVTERICPESEFQRVGTPTENSRVPP